MRKRLFILTLVLFGLTGCLSESEPLNSTSEVQESGNNNGGVQVDGLGSFTISEGTAYSDDRDTGIDVITLEEAAEIGAHYIYEVLGESLEGTHIELTYNYNFNISERTWGGLITHSDEVASDLSNVFISFLIDAETGERLNLMFWELEPLRGISDTRMEIMPIEELLEIFPEPDEDEIVEMMEVVREIATRHLQNSEVVRLEYGFLMENGEADTTYYPSQMSPFFIIDTEGRMIEIIIQRETHLLFMINVPFS